MKSTYDEDEFDFFKIDLNRLDEEWVRQPQLMFTYGRKLSDAKEDLERAKSAKDIVEAELDLDIRMHPEKYELGKITEGAINKTIILRKEYQTAHERVIKAKHRVDVLTAAVDALEHKKKGLESCVYLHGQEYFASPKAPKGQEDEVKRMKRDHAFGKSRGPKS